MFQAFLDESEKSSLFVMGGFVASSESWASFSDEWQRHIDYDSPHYRKLDWFHLKEMTSERDRERVAWFYRVIEAHVHSAISLVIDMAALKRVYEEFDWPVQARKKVLTNPHFIAFRSVLGGIPSVQGRIGIHTPIDFFFDETSNKIGCLRGWDLMKRNAPPEVLALMGETPAFRNDKKVLPLQAADLWAGITREWAEELLASGNQELAFPLQNRQRSLDVMGLFLGEKRLRRGYERIFEAMREKIAKGDTFDDDEESD